MLIKRQQLLTEGSHRLYLALQIQDTYVWVVSQQQTYLEEVLSACVWGFATLAVKGCSCESGLCLQIVQGEKMA